MQPCVWFIFNSTNLPTYICSCRNIEAKNVTMTVFKGLNIAENTGPLFWIIHDCANMEIPEPTIP